MSRNQMVDSAADVRRAHVEALLAAYPDVTPEERGLLVNWFKNEASALDVGLVASNPVAQRGYHAFRCEHVDRFTTRDVVGALVFAALLAALLLLAALGAAG